MITILCRHLINNNRKKLFISIQKLWLQAQSKITVIHHYNGNIYL